MAGYGECDGYEPRHYKKWRYPGVPIPHRLRGKYTIDGKRPKFR